MTGWQVWADIMLCGRRQSLHDNGWVLWTFCLTRPDGLPRGASHSWAQQRYEGASSVFEPLRCTERELATDT